MVTETLTIGMDGPTKHGLLQLASLSIPPTGGTIPGADGTPIGMAGTPHGGGILHGDQDPRHGGMETGTLGTDPLGSKEQESMFLKNK